MLQAGQGLAHFLGVRLVAAEFTAPTRPGARRLGWAALALLAVWLVGRRVRSARHDRHQAEEPMPDGGGEVTQ